MITLGKMMKIGMSTEKFRETMAVQTRKRRTKLFYKISKTKLQSLTRNSVHLSTIRLKCQLRRTSRLNWAQTVTKEAKSCSNRALSALNVKVCQKYLKTFFCTLENKTRNKNCLTSCCFQAGTLLFKGLTLE